MKRSRPVPTSCAVYSGSLGRCDWSVVRTRCAGGWKHPLPSLVVVPTRGHVNDLKMRLIAKGSSYLGLQFATPPSLRALLARDDAAPAAEREHLRLFLAIAASEIENRPNDSEALAAKAVARAPALLLRALDRLETAGWKFQELGLSSFAPVVQRFNELLKKCGLVLPGEADRKRLQEATRGRPEFSHVLITGFDGAHWAEWFLLRSAVELAENATIVLEEPRQNFSDVDLCWIGSWEEICGEARRSPRATTSLGDCFLAEWKCAEGRKRQSARFSNRHKFFGTSRSDDPAMHPLFGR